MGHPQSEKSMAMSAWAMSGLSGRKALVGTGWTICHLLHMNGLKKTDLPCCMTFVLPSLGYRLLDITRDHWSLLESCHCNHTCLSYAVHMQLVSRPYLSCTPLPRLQTALHKAAWFGYRRICYILVAAGASLLREDHQVRGKAVL